MAYLKKNNWDGLKMLWNVTHPGKRFQLRKPVPAEFDSTTCIRCIDLGDALDKVSTEEQWSGPKWITINTQNV